MKLSIKSITNNNVIKKIKKENRKLKTKSKNRHIKQYIIKNIPLNKELLFGLLDYLAQVNQHSVRR
jgi:hypothetical protein